MVMAAPLLLLGTVAVALSSGRPLFFGHTRVGRNGRLYRCWKLRTMQSDAEERLEAEPALKQAYVQNGYKLSNRQDPRVTPIGRLLRRTYIDEIPQLFNVLIGDMSLIGPRPLVPSELDWYGADVAELLSRKPGIVGAWTSRGRARPSYPERARVEITYVRHRTLGADLAILLRSIPVVLKGQADE